jgi:hypothetical protein
MLHHRRIALVCAVGALAATPGTALAMPATDAPPPPRPVKQVAVEPATPVDSGSSDTTLALVFSGSALLIAAGAAALSTHDHRRLGRIA